MKKNISNISIISLQAIASLVTLMVLSACEGTFDWVYDKPEPVKPTQGQFYLDATDWKKWYYINLPAIADSTRNNPEYDPSGSIVAYDIPFDATGEETAETGHHMTGQYMYWFDVFGEGIKKNSFAKFTPTVEQPAPDDWTIAIHRNNARTNGCAVYESSVTDINDLPSSDTFGTLNFIEDEWSENEVWDDQSQMLACYIPSQGIKLSKVLSSWLDIDLPPIPPEFHHNMHVFVIRLADGTYGAIQLVDYISPTGTKCCMTIKYKYPL